MQIENSKPYEVAKKLVDFYERPFGGKSNGRYRISPKNLRRLMQRRRISDEFIRLLAEEMFELGYIFIDMQSFYVVTSARSFSNYRRLADALID
ncbi:MAG: hypothetical protein HQ504_12905 [Rhodospirillaceae bacterium]|nr:hypothetical protein [Rhodospirillaceae bacterium]